MPTVMSWDEWYSHDGLGLAELIRSGKVTAAELAEQATAAVAKVNPEIDGVLEIFEDTVKDPFAEGTNPEGIFAGLPFLVKDTGCTTMKGRLQEMGSMMLQGNRAAADGFLTTQFRKAGLNLIGRTTAPEFATCSSCENPALHTTRNPWDTEFTSCGSSAGSAVMVGAGAVPMASGSDGGGSLRIPAGVNGAISIKTSRGVFSQAPFASDFSSVVSTQGALTRTVRDSAAFVDACRGGAPGEFMPYWFPDEPYLELIKRDPKPLKIAVSHEWGPYKADPEIAADLERVAQQFAALGHHVEWKVPEVDFQLSYEAQTACYITNFAQTVNNLLIPRGYDRPPEGLIEPINIKIWEAGINGSYTDRANMQLAFNTVSRQLGNFFEDWDIILTPIIAHPTPRLDTQEYLTSSDNPSVMDWFENLWAFFAFTPICNLAGTPGISLPMGRLPNGLPLGMHATTKQGNDGLLLQLAAQVERSLNGDWFDGRKPQVHITN
ncbi:amidase [Pseudodonghicola flavimaris]|uniref:Amidase n=1 Tax=Pseudodonghicola flavimaris TaxID=3050036 RepID=A0ABT7F0A1_9RHOB|nr:amidase [Pseudodonghicola flavimaris]MDK3018036.1 amidase [Pseudodonghicola flavimaris]